MTRRHRRSHGPELVFGLLTIAIVFALITVGGTVLLLAAMDAMGVPRS